MTFEQEQKQALVREISALRAEMEARRRWEEAEQEQLSKDIWNQRKQPDATWDTQAVALSDPRPLRIEKVLGDLGFKRSGRHVHRISALVYAAYVKHRGIEPRPKIYYGVDGTPESVSCYTEDDRALITTVVIAHGEAEDLPTTNRAG